MTLVLLILFGGLSATSGTGESEVGGERLRLSVPSEKNSRDLEFTEKLPCVSTGKIRFV